MAFGISKVGKLGESSGTSYSGTLYTVGTGKTAVVQFLISAYFSTSGTITVKFNGTNIYSYTGTDEVSTHLPGNNDGGVTTVNMHRYSGALTTGYTPEGNGLAGLFPHRYYLDDGDTFTATISGASNYYFLIMGTEYTT